MSPSRPSPEESFDNPPHSRARKELQALAGVALVGCGTFSMALGGSETAAGNYEAGSPILVIGAALAIAGLRRWEKSDGLANLGGTLSEPSSKKRRNNSD